MATTAEVEETGLQRQVVIFRSIRGEPRQVLEYYVVDDSDPYECFSHLCDDIGMMKCRYREASGEAILATITEPPRSLHFELAVEALTIEIDRAAQGFVATSFGFIREVVCAPGVTLH
jgi:hypothetical protein